MFLLVKIIAVLGSYIKQTSLCIHIKMFFMIEIKNYINAELQ